MLPSVLFATVLSSIIFLIIVPQCLFIFRIGSGIVSDLAVCILIWLLLIWLAWIGIIDVERHRHWDSVVIVVGIVLFIRGIAPLSLG